MTETSVNLPRLLAENWLNILGGEVEQLQAAALMACDSNQGGRVQMVARWPSVTDGLSNSQKLFKFAVKYAKNVYIPGVKSETGVIGDLIAFPVELNSRAQKVLVVKISPQPENKHNEVLARLDEALFSGQAGQSNSQSVQCVDQFYGELTRLLAACIEQRGFNQTLIKLVAELTRILKCERVALGECGTFHTDVRAISNIANFDSRTNLLQKTAAALDECVEQNCAVIYPSPDKTVISRDHAELSRQFGVGYVFTLPMIHEGSVWGAVMFMRQENRPFNDVDIAFCEQAIALVTPHLALHKESEKSLLGRCWEELGNALRSLFGLRYLKAKLLSLTLVGLLITASVIDADFRVTATAVLEGKIQRVIASPVDGFVVTAGVRAGDVVQQDDVLAQLDDSELKLEISRQEGQLQKLKQEYREARASNDLVKIQLHSARIKQTEAELQLAQQQLQQITLRAPFDGVLIEGDLSEMLGSPVKRGDLLFKLAPLQGYRIILKVNERFISYLKTGQPGALSLTSLPRQKFALTIESITPAAQVEGGENIFRIEAALTEGGELLRPGMEGVAKIEAGKGKLIWIWTHELVERTKLWFWSLLP